MGGLFGGVRPSKRAIEEGKVRFQTSFRVENGLKYALKAINSQN